ncbi:MFS transporter [Chengkuizengella axinellae]|uniref:MFS transporter n=1 Tax=Chengkuizengella axinellae TaxID=3064388 RepID=A0ABT9IUK6_9BACL|nr:MFS transporter [Chengkuizengella sp. 2205SS18-9]MDP5272968.1 MFS transporter [Chengkuizengella sp. 2205SS18-9]
MKTNTIASHNINVLFWVQFFGAVSFIQPVLSLFYFERGLNESLILLTMFFWSFSVLICEIPTGVFADRFGAKVSFLTGSVIKFFSISILLFADEPWMFFLSAALNGFSVTFFSGADEALIYESLKESNEHHLMDQAMGKIISAGFISTIIAVILGSIIAKDLENEQFILLIALGLFFQLVEIIFICFVKNPKHQGSYRNNPLKQVGAGIKAIRKTPLLLLMFLNVTLVFIPSGAVYEKFDQLIFHNAGLPVIFIGMFYSFAAIIGFFASRSIGLMTKRISRIFLMNLTGVLTVVGLLLSALFGETLWIVLGAFFILRFVRAIRYPIYSQLSNDLIPSDVRATTISLLSIIDSGLDLIIFGFLAGVALNGLNHILMICAAIAFIGTILPLKGRTKRS